MRKLIIAMAAVAAFSTAATAQSQGPNTILNVSYDIGRELFAAVNVAFVKSWKAKTGQDITVNQSHAGSSRQARSVLEGLEADVVTFNQVTDVQILHDRGKLIPANWQSRLPNKSSPFYSLPAFLVRAGNPKQIKDWDDLVRALFKNVPVFDTGGRAATTTFLEREIGDVLITFEAETNGIRDQFPGKVQVVVPAVSLLAEFPVSVVDRVVDKRGSRAVATAYLEFLYSPEGQEVLARLHNRVHHPEVVAQFKDKFPQVRLLTVEAAFGGWEQLGKEHLASGAKLDQLYVNR